MDNNVDITKMLQAGMRASKLKSVAVANNIANLGSPGYRRKDVRFQELLAKAVDSTGSMRIEDIQGELFEPRSTAVSSNGNDVDLDVEVGEVQSGQRHAHGLGAQAGEVAVVAGSVGGPVLPLVRERPLRPGRRRGPILREERVRAG